MRLMDRWYTTCQQLSITPNTSLFNDISQRYSTKDRHYHTLQHLSECFHYFDLVKNLAKNPAAIEMAIWFHDIVYNTKKGGNELSSSKLAIACLTSNGITHSIMQNIEQLILITDHQHQPITVDEQIMLDIDLAILGASRQRFAEYQQQIRAEYSWVPYFLFRQKRRAILAAFLQRPTIYHTAVLSLLLEKQARVNLQQAVHGNQQ